MNRDSFNFKFARILLLFMYLPRKQQFEYIEYILDLK